MLSSAAIAARASVPRRAEFPGAVFSKREAAAGGRVMHRQPIEGTRQKCQPARPVEDSVRAQVVDRLDDVPRPSASWTWIDSGGRLGPAALLGLKLCRAGLFVPRQQKRPRDAYNVLLQDTLYFNREVFHEFTVCSAVVT